MTWQLVNGLGSGSVISVNFLEVPVAEADLRFGVQSGLKSDIARARKVPTPELRPFQISGKLM